MAAPLDGDGLPLDNNKPEALWGQFLQLRALRRAMPNNSPEMPVTRVCEAGGANRSKFRPGYEVRMIPGESSVQPVMVVAWMRRPTDRPSRHAYCKEKMRHHYICAPSRFPFGSAASAPSLSTISRGSR